MFFAIMPIAAQCDPKAVCALLKPTRRPTLCTTGKNIINHTATKVAAEERERLCVCRESIFER